MPLLLFYYFRTQFQFTDLAFMQTVSSNSCATRCSRKFHVSMHMGVFLNVLKSIDNREIPGVASLIISTSMSSCSSVKPSPSKKSRGGGQGGLRRAPTLGAPTPLSHATGQSAVDSRLVYHSHFKSTDSEADGGKN